MSKKLYRHWYVFLLFVIAGSLIYWNCLSNPFIYDDEMYVVNNLNIRTLDNFSLFFKKASTLTGKGYPGGHYRPLVVLSYAINYAVGGLNTFGYHVVNLVFHIGAAFLVFLIMKAMFNNSEQVADKTANCSLFTANHMAALSAGLIFLLHPFNTETVNYITARSTVLSGFFYLLAFWCWVKFREHRAKSKEQGAIDTQPLTLNPQRYYIASLLAFIAGMLSKEVLVTLPIMLWLYDLYFINIPQSSIRNPQLNNSTLRNPLFLNWRTFVPYIPFLLIVAVPYVLLRIFYFGRIVPNFQRDIFTQIFTVIPVLVKHWQMFLIPVPLTLVHFEEINKTFWSFQVIHSALILLISAAIAILLSLIRYRPWRVVSFFLLWFFIVIMPVTIFPLNAIFQENRGYVAIVSFAVLAGVIVGELWKTGIRKVAVGLLVLITLAYASGVVQRNRVWRDNVTLWSDAAQKAPDIPITHISLGSAYRKAGKYDQAIAAYRNAKTVGGPTYPDARYKLAQVYIEQERWDLAAPELEEAKEILLNAPDRRNELEIVYKDLEMVYHKSGKLELAKRLQKEAREHLRGGQ